MWHSTQAKEAPTLVGEVCGVAAGPVDGAEVDDLGVVQVRVVVASHQHELVGHCDGEAHGEVVNTGVGIKSCP